MNNHHKLFTNSEKEIDLTDPYKIAKFIKESKKRTPVKVYIKGNIDEVVLGQKNIKVFGEDNFQVLIGEYEDIHDVLVTFKSNIKDHYIECDRKNSAIPLLDIKNIQARIEPGAIIREGTSIGKNAVIMMGAIINLGVQIGENTMIDMNSVIGARAIIGKNCHVGAGAVVAGVLEPPSKAPVIIEDDVLIGANAVLLEGVKVNKGAVVAAGSIVTRDVPCNSVVAGIPAKVIKEKDTKTIDKVKILEDLRG